MDWFEYQGFSRWMGTLMERHVKRAESPQAAMQWSSDPLANFSNDALFETLVRRHLARVAARNAPKPDPAVIAAGTKAWSDMWAIEPAANDAD